MKYFRAEDFTYGGIYRDYLKAMKPALEQAIMICQQAKSEAAANQFGYAANLEKGLLLTSFHMASKRSVFDEKDLLIGLIEEGSSTSAWLLEQQGIQKIDLLNYVSHKISKLEGHPALKYNPNTSTGFLDQFKRYKVLAFNDDYTAMDFVVWILKTEFGKSEKDARALMLQAHEQGSAVIGHYTLSLAQTKIKKAVTLAQENNFPLLLKVET